MTGKSALRRQCLAKRAAVTERDRDEKTRMILHNLFSLKEYIDSELVLVYVCVNDEISTREIIEKSLLLGKKVAVPRVDSGNMEFRYLDSLQALVPGEYGIPTSCGDKPGSFDSCFCVTPALCVDRGFHRLGYGGGYYDRFISANGGVFYAVPVFDDFIYEEIPHSSYDMAVDCIISEKRIERRCI